MHVHDICISFSNNKLIVEPYRINMGFQYDNMANKLHFQRPGQLEDYEMILQFKSKYLHYAPLNLGSYNEYLIPNILMISEKLQMQISFQKGNILLHAKAITFDISPSIGYSGVLPLEPWPLPSGPPGPQGEQGPQGERGEDGKAPVIGETKNWFCWSDEKECYQDTGIPVSGRDGTSITVNGISHTDGNILLTATDIPLQGEGLESILDKKALYFSENYFCNRSSDWLNGEKYGLDIKYDPADEVFTINGTVECPSQGVFITQTLGQRNFDWVSGQDYTMQLFYLGGEISQYNGLSLSAVAKDKQGKIINSEFYIGGTFGKADRVVTHIVTEGVAQYADIIGFRLWVLNGIMFDNYRFRAQFTKGGALPRWIPSKNLLGIYEQLEQLEIKINLAVAELSELISLEGIK